MNVMILHYVDINDYGGLDILNPYNIKRSPIPPNYITYEETTTFYGRFCHCMIILNGSTHALVQSNFFQKQHR